MACLECNLSVHHLASIIMTCEGFVTTKSSTKSLSLDTIASHSLKIRNNYYNKIEIGAKTESFDIHQFFASLKYDSDVGVLRISASAEIEKKEDDDKNEEGQDLVVTANYELLSVGSDVKPFVLFTATHDLLSITSFSLDKLYFGIAEVCPIDYVHSCFGAGYWIDDLAWADDDAWRDN